MNKKAYSVGFTWIYALVMLVGIGILYIVFSQVFTAHLVPAVKQQVNMSTIDLATKTEIYNNIDKYMSFFNILPFALFFVIILYMIIAAVRRETQDVYQ